MKRPIFLDSFTVWLYYPSLIKWKIEQRNKVDKIEKDYLISTINASLIIEMATFWEGIVNEMQTEIFFDRLGQKDKFHESLNEYFDEKLSKATWATYIKVFDLLLGESLTNRIENENWKAINILFNFRNMLVHGKEIQIDYFEDGGKIGVESPNGFKKTFEYLKEKKLLNVSLSPRLNSVDMLNSDVVDFLYNHLIKFIENLFDLFPDSEVGELRKNFNECLTF